MHCPFVSKTQYEGGMFNMHAIKSLQVLYRMCTTVLELANSPLINIVEFRAIKADRFRGATHGLFTMACCADFYRQNCWSSRDARNYELYKKPVICRTDDWVCMSTSMSFNRCYLWSLTWLPQSAYYMSVIDHWLLSLMTL